MHEHVSKCVKMHRKPTGGANKHGKHIITRSGKERGMHKATGIMEMPPKWLHPDKALWASDVTTQPQPAKGVKLRASSIAKPRTGEASTEDKAQK